MKTNFAFYGTAGLTALAVAVSATYDTSSTANAQAIERNPAPLEFGKRTSALTPRELVDIKQDPTPFGVALSKLVVVDERANGAGIKRRRGAKGVVLSQAGEVGNSDALEARLAPFLGKPLSFQLISELQVEVTRHYREAGLPLVNVTIPPQEISDGGLQVNVITFLLGEKRLAGESRTPTDFVLNQLRTIEGDEVVPSSLSADIDWLNQNPHRGIQGVFEPGKEYGTTDIVLEVEDRRPWTGYAGISNTGTSGTFKTRFFTGFNTTALPWPDHQLSYRFTAAPDNLTEFRLFKNGNEKGYLSHALSYFVPITTKSGQRRKLTFELLNADSFTDTGAATTARNLNNSLSAELAALLPRQTQGDFTVSPEIFGKLAYETLDKNQFFNGTLASTEDTTNIRASLGARAITSGQLFGQSARGSFEVSLDVGQADSSLSGNDTYAYLSFTGGQTIALPNQNSLAVSLRGQVTGSDLTSLDQFGVGGVGSVRGYETNEVSSNSAVVLNIELRGQPITSETADMNTVFQPYGFFDLGYSGGTNVTDDEELASIGVGFNSQIGKSLTAKAEAAYALSSAAETEQGDFALHFEIVGRF